MLGVNNNGTFSKHRLPSFNCAYGLPTRHRKEDLRDSWANNKERVKFLYHIFLSIAYHLDPNHLGYSFVHESQQF